MNRRDRYIYLYMRYAFIAYAFLLFLIIIFLLTGVIISLVYNQIIFGVLLLIVPAFFILPGIIYDNYKPTYLGLTRANIKYELFLVFTLGFGPIYLFFKHYDAEFKRYFKNKQN